MTDFVTLPVVLSITLLFATVFSIWKRNRLFQGLSAFFLLSSLYGFAGEIIPLFGTVSEAEYQAVTKFIASLWWCSLGYLVNFMVDRFIWHGRLAWDGEPAVPRLLREIAGLLVYLVVAMIILRIVYNQSITVGAATSGVFAVIMGYSAQSTLREVFAGISLNLDAPFKKGDLIEIDGDWGWVKDMNWRSVTYQDMDRNVVVLPNSKVADSTIRIMTRPDKMMRRTIFFHTDYRAPPVDVVELAEQCLMEVPTVAPHPWNFAAFYGHEEIGARYGINFHVNSFDDWYITGDHIANTLWHKLARAGIRYSYHRRLNYTTPEDEADFMAGSNYDQPLHKDPVNLFRRLPLFKPLTDGEIEQLADSASWCQFGTPERIVREYELRHSIFIIDYGRVEVFETLEDGSETKLPDLLEDLPIGILALLTGGMQQTTIRAAEETAVWEIKGDILRAVFNNHPEAMEEIASTVATWQAEEDDALQVRKIGRREKDQNIDSQSISLTKRIAKFFVQNRSRDKSIEYTES